MGVVQSERWADSSGWPTSEAPYGTNHPRKRGPEDQELRAAVWVCCPSQPPTRFRNVALSFLGISSIIGRDGRGATVRGRCTAGTANLRYWRLASHTVDPGRASGAGGAIAGPMPARQSCGDAYADQNPGSPDPANQHPPTDAHTPAQCDITPSPLPSPTSVPASPSPPAPADTLALIDTQPAPSATPTLPAPTSTATLPATAPPPSPQSATATPTARSQPTIPPQQDGEWDMEAGFVPGSSPLGEDCPGWAVAVGWQAFVAPGTPASSCLNENKY